MDLEKILEYAPRIIYGVLGVAVMTSQIYILASAYSRRKQHLAYIAEKEAEMLANHKQVARDEGEIRDRLRMAAVAEVIGDKEGAQVHTDVAHSIYERYCVQAAQALHYFLSRNKS